jgi:hypothetical protein
MGNGNSSMNSPIAGPSPKSGPVETPRTAPVNVPSGRPIDHHDSTKTWQPSTRPAPVVDRTIRYPATAKWRG